MKNFDEFKNPNADFRGKPFWAWNGKLQKDELLRQIHVAKDMGMGGLFMHSRIGLETEYLGEEWFSLINECGDELHALGMEAWLYDEDRWPSGSAGGMATKKPENRMKFIVLHIDEEIPKDTEILGCFACDLKGVNFYNKEKISPETPADQNIIWFDVKEAPASAEYNGFTYLDTMSREATDDFIKITHQKYAEHCKDRLGTTIKGIFTDEPHRGHVMCDAMYNGMAAPYTSKLFEEFRKRYGYDLQENLPELFLRKDGEAVSQVKWHYMELIQQLFLDNFAKPIHEWCKKHNLLFTGHALHENSLAAQSIMLGSMMRFYERLDYPGVDVLVDPDDYCIVKQLSSVTNQLGQKWLLSELYGVTGWQTNFERYKNIGDWQALMGINLRCHHLSWYTMKGQAKRDYPASIFHQSAWYKEFKYVEDYFSRLGVFLSQGVSVRDCLVINPVESVWAQVYTNWSSWLYSKDADLAALDEHYKKVYQYLLECNVNFDYADEEMLARLYRIEGDTITVGQASYKKIIVSGMVTMRKSTLDIVNRFAENGGTVIVLGEKPKYIDAVYTEVLLKAEQLEFSKENIAKLKNPIIFSSAPEIFIEIKQTDDAVYTMLLNMDRHRSVCADVSFNIDGYFEEWCARSGERYACEKPSQLFFNPGEEKLFLISKTNENLAKYKPVEYKEPRKLSKIRGYSISEPNICVLDMAKCTVNGETLEERDVLRIDRKLREKFHLHYRSGEMLQPWFIANESHPALAQVSLEYDFYIDADMDDIELVVEEAKNLAIEVNGVPVNETIGKWIDICFDKICVKKDILKQGKNTVTLKFPFKADSNIEAVYLLGNFGVTLDGAKATLTELPAAIGFGDLKNYGLPFYSGKITYYFETDFSGSGKVKLDSLFGAACMKANNTMIAFPPYEAEIEVDQTIAIELILTRRNTFGPLHHTNIYLDSCSPESFITAGDDYSENFCLYPAGISEPPILYAKK